MKPKRTPQLRHCLLLVILYPFIPAHAQRSNVALKAGPTFSNLSSKAVSLLAETETKVNVTFGVIVNIPIIERFSIRPSIEFVSKGACYIEDFLNLPPRHKIHFNYFDLPLNLVYEFPIKRNKLIAGGGPVFSFLINQSYKVYKKNDIGVNVLTGYELAAGPGLYLNLTQGLKNILVNKTNGGMVQNSYFGVTVGYWFKQYKTKQ